MTDTLAILPARALRPAACPCCSAPDARAEWGVVSAFLARRALGEPPAPTRLFRCRECGHAWSERALTAEQERRLYVGYRDERYFAERSATEPWYTAEINESIGSEPTMVGRRAAMEGTLARAAALVGERPVGVALDFGGDKGQMLKGLPDAKKLVHEFSGAAAEPWAEQAPSLAPWVGACDLAMACQVMEHVEDPVGLAREVAGLAKRGGWVYLEVPFEQWRQSRARAKWRERWLARVAAKPWLLQGLDFASTAARIKFGWIPPFGFWAMREHLNFFTERSLSEVASKAGLRVALVERNASGLALVGVKP